MRLSTQMPHRLSHLVQVPVLLIGLVVGLPLRTLSNKQYHYALVYMCMVLGLPLYRLGWAQAWWLYLWMHGTSSLVVGVLFVISHNHPRMHQKFGTPAMVSTVYSQFVQTTVHHSLSWGGLTACLLFGGINYQVEHHLAPSASPLLLHYAAPFIQEILRKHSLPYQYEPTGVHAVYQMVTHLVAMSV